MNPAVAPLYAWNQALADRLAGQIDRLPHALLLTGPEGMGKAAFVARLVHWLLCSQREAALQPCGRCQSCRLTLAGTHPDYAGVAPAEAGKAILVDQIRGLGDFFALRPHTAHCKVASILPADAMNISASNSLLKMLEEPPAGAFIILASARANRLPATVRSRCTRLDFRLPDRQQALQWLADQSQAPEQAGLLLNLAHGAPLRALQLAQSGYLKQREQLAGDIQALSGRQTDPSSCAARWKTIGTERCLGWLEGWIADLIRLSLVPHAQGLANPDMLQRLQALQKQLDLKQLFHFHETVSESSRLLGGPLDELLVLEDVLIRWTRLTRH